MLVFLSASLSVCCLSVGLLFIIHPLVLPCISPAVFNHPILIQHFICFGSYTDAVKLLLVPFFLTILGLLLLVQTYLSPKFDTHFMNSAVFYYGKSYSDFSAYS